MVSRKISTPMLLQWRYNRNFTSEKFVLEWRKIYCPIAPDPPSGGGKFVMVSQYNLYHSNIHHIKEPNNILMKILFGIFCSSKPGA